ncbi:hypothetical protein J4444_02040 [Candidatus Woesearchaeota archaeon]|nr:hypothetical protein [Candidatus Woesearchaeota archaeon]
MATEIDTEKIIERLDAIKIELDYIKENLPDKDIFLTPEERILLEESYSNEKEGKLVSSKDLRKNLGV